MPEKEQIKEGAALQRRNFLRLLGGGAAGLCLSTAWAAKARRKPNVIVIVSDDQGYADVGAYGCRDIPTPHIDSIAKNGVSFSSGYVSCPLCSPTRAGLLTGRYQQRFGFEFNTGKPARVLQEDIGLPLSEQTLADAMKGLGYVTGVVGKWHLGMQAKYHPLKRGFDEFFGFLHGGHAYLDLQPRGRNPIMRGGAAVAEKEYLTDAFNREAVSFVKRHKKKPFFLYLAYNAPHKPLQATKKYLDRFAHIKDHSRRTYAAMVSAMDDGVGQVLSSLRAAGLEQDTLIFFLSDNGGASKVAPADNGKLRSHKGAVYEGGVRVPFMVQWKGRLPAGKTFHQPVTSLDIFPTAVAAAGGVLPAKKTMDGVDLLPFLKGTKKSPPHGALYWRLGRRRAVRQGKWKVVQRGARPAELYDLSADVGEQQDLSAQKPHKVKELSAALARWESQLAQPLWGPARRGRRFRGRRRMLRRQRMLRRTQ